MKLNNLVRVKQFLADYPQFSYSAIQHLIFNRKSNGFDCCVKKIGKSIYLDVEAVSRYFENSGHV